MFFSWHSRIIWLGDLNYRIALSYRCAKALVEMRNWRALLENDQACQKPLGTDFIMVLYWFYYVPFGGNSCESSSLQS